MDYQHSFEGRGAMSEPPVLRPGQPVGESLRAIAGHLLTEAHDILEDEGREPAIAVHDIRKELKRWRAMLRLLAPFLDDDSQSLAHGCARACAKTDLRTRRAIRDRCLP